MHWRRKWQPTPVFLPGESQGQRSLVGCRLWGGTESDMNEQLHFHFSLSWVGEGNGNPLQCSCLENPRDEGAWWAAVCGVAQSWTGLKRRSSSSSSSLTSPGPLTQEGTCHLIKDKRPETGSLSPILHPLPLPGKALINKWQGRGGTKWG